ncbi:TolC family protein [Bdellovibrionota bacterium FG-1]
MSFILGLIFLLVASSYGAEAVPSLTLSSALEAARDHSPDLKKREIQADSSSWGKLEALSEHLPHLSAHGTHFLGAKYSNLGVLFGGNAVHFPSAFPQTDFELEASVLLFDGLAAINRYRASSLENEAAQFEWSHAKFGLEEGIRIKFYQALAALELAKVADQNIETLEQHLTLARANQRAGFSTNIDVLRIESQLEEARAEKLLAADNIATARQALFETMGVEVDDRPLAGTLPQPNPKIVPETLSLDMSQGEDVQAQSLRERAQDRLSSAAGGFWFPRVSLFGVEQFYKYGEFDPAILPNSSFENAYSFGLRLSWNLFDGGAAMAKQHRSEDAAKIASEDYRKTLISSPNEFAAWKRRFSYNAVLYEARKRSVAKSTESVRLATLATRAGTKTHSETLDAELELFRARAGVIRAQLDASEALAKLELALGHRL